MRRADGQPLLALHRVQAPGTGLGGHGSAHRSLISRVLFASMVSERRVGETAYLSPMAATNGVAPSNIKRFRRPSGSRSLNEGVAGPRSPPQPQGRSPSASSCSGGSRCSLASLRAFSSSVSHKDTCHRGHPGHPG